MVKAIYAGSFDPITLGHIDIFKRSMKVCDELTIGIGVNSAKKTLFTEDERVKQVNRAVDAHCDFLTAVAIKVVSFQGLLVNFAREVGATVLIRGIRSVSDFEYELTLANINKELEPFIETIFLPTSPHLSMISSSMVKELAKYGSDVSKYVPDSVNLALKKQIL